MTSRKKIRFHGLLVAFTFLWSGCVLGPQPIPPGADDKTQDSADVSNTADAGYDPSTDDDGIQPLPHECDGLFTNESCERGYCNLGESDAGVSGDADCEEDDDRDDPCEPGCKTEPDQRRVLSSMSLQDLLDRVDESDDPSNAIDAEPDNCDDGDGDDGDEDEDEIPSYSIIW